MVILKKHPKLNLRTSCKSMKTTDYVILTLSRAKGKNLQDMGSPIKRHRVKRKSYPYARKGTFLANIFKLPPLLPLPQFLLVFWCRSPPSRGQASLHQSPIRIKAFELINTRSEERRVGK